MLRKRSIFHDGCIKIMGQISRVIDVKGDTSLNFKKSTTFRLTHFIERNAPQDN